MLYDKLNCTCAIETFLHKHMSVTVTVESRYIEVTGTAVYSSKYPRFDISV